MTTLSDNSASFEVQAAAGNPAGIAIMQRLSGVQPSAVEPRSDAGGPVAIGTDKMGSGKVGSGKTAPKIRFSGRAAGRQSQSPGQAAVQSGGLGYIARRGVPYRTALLLRQVGGVEALAEFQPLELLMLCADLVPEVSQAVWNFLLLGCSPGFVTLVAMTDAVDDQGQKTGDSEEAPDGTAILTQFFENQPQESGDFNQQLVTNTLMTLFSGMAATEYVPGPETSGQGASFPVDTLTLTFKRPPDNGPLILTQKQSGPMAQGQVTTFGAGTNMVDMPMSRFFWDSMHRYPDDPYGRAPFGAALTPVLDYLAFIRDLTIAFHRVGMPRYDVTYDYAASVDFVVKVKQFSDPDEIADEVKRMFEEFVADFNSLQIDDTFFHMTGTDVNVTGSGMEMPDVSSIFDIYRYRMVIALKQNPVLMSYVEGSTETWSEIQWEAFSNGLKAIVTPAVSPLKDSGQLHLQLLGLAYKVVAKFGDVRTVNRLQNAQAAQIEIGNEAEKRDQGWQSQDTAAQKTTGSAPVGDPPPTLSEQDKQAKKNQQAQQQAQANALRQQKPAPVPAKK